MPASSGGFSNSLSLDLSSTSLRSLRLCGFARAPRIFFAQRRKGAKFFKIKISRFEVKRDIGDYHIPKGPLELMLWTTRHSERDLNEIMVVLTAHPASVPVLLHFQNSAGRRITIAAHESFNVKRDDALEAALARWLED